MSSPILQSNGLVPLPTDIPSFLEAYLPRDTSNKPFITLTYAQSIDAKIAITGERTVISHIETKTMTHYLRSQHDAILVGYKTAVIDDPKLNNRFDNRKIRPVVVDPDFKWDYKGSKLEELVKKGEGLPPVVIVKIGDGVDEEKVKYLEENNGNILRVESHENGLLRWKELFDGLYALGLKSVMVEGGAHVIKELLKENTLVNSLVVTIGSTYLGTDGVDISPSGTIKLKDIAWWKGTSDTVLAARLQ